MIGLRQAETGGERIGDEAIPNPGIDALALVTDGGGLGRGRRLDGGRLWLARLAGRSLVLDHLRRRGKLAFDNASSRRPSSYLGIGIIRPSRSKSPAVSDPGRTRYRAHSSILTVYAREGPQHSSQDSPPKPPPHNPASTRAACCAAGTSKRRHAFADHRTAAPRSDWPRRRQDAARPPRAPHPPGVD